MNNSVKKALISTLICNILVLYDYVLFGSMADIISDLFFPTEDKYISLIATFSVFGIGFLVRPIGASVLGHIGDKYGRKISLLITSIAMSVVTLLIAIIPTYQSIGIIAPITLAICRLIQGFSVSGEAGSAAFLIEHSRDGKNRAVLGSFEIHSATFGVALSFAIISITKCFTNEFFTVWGWRIPFIFGFLISFIGIYIRYVTDESPEYEFCKNNNKLVANPLVELCKNYKKPLILAIAIDCIEYTAYYMIMVFFLVFIQEVSNVHIEFRYAIIILSTIIVGVLTMVFAILSDKFGRKKIMIGATIGLFIVSLPVFWLLCQDSDILVLIAYVVFAIPLSAALGPTNALIYELFSTEIRCTGFTLARNIAGAISGGLMPLIYTLMIKITGIKIIPGLCIMICYFIGFIALLQIKEKNYHVNSVK